MVFSIEYRILIENLYKCVKANGLHFEHLLWLSWLLFECFVNIFVLTLTWHYHPILVFITMNVSQICCLCYKYSRRAKNRCGGKYNTGFITIFLRCIVAKNYPNWPRINKVIGKIKRVQFFWNTVYFSITIVPVNDGSRREWFSEDWCLLLYADIRADVSIWFCHPLVPICQ